MVTGELGDSLLRETQEGRLRIEIRVPVYMDREVVTEAVARHVFR